jgi:hypothetical protein
LLAGFSLAGALVLSILMPVEVGGKSLLELFVGHKDLDVPPIVLVCGVALSSGAIILGTGTAARILGITAILNKWRLLLVIPQVAAVSLAASTGDALFAAAGLALSTVLTALTSILIVSRSVKRGGRRG